MPLGAFCLEAKEKTSLFNHLHEVNKNWQMDVNPMLKTEVSFNTDIERIQFHLLMVESKLRSQQISHLSANQQANRLRAIDILHNYALAKKFPINTDHKVRQPYFIDKYGTYCAVGFLVKETGFDEISVAISKRQNYAYVKEIDSPELVKWSKDFGFSLEELALIQPSYAPSESYSQVGGGTNGDVTCSQLENTRWLIGGDFDTLDNLPCLNVGVYENDQLNCLGTGIDGVVIGIGPKGQTGVTVAGSFPDTGFTYPLAHFDGINWSYDSIPNRTNPTVRAFASTAYDLLRIAIDDPMNIDEQEIWQKNQGVWTLLLKVKGEVHFLDKDLILCAGEFDSVQVVSTSTWYTTKNAFYQYAGWQTVQGDVPDVVKTAELIGLTLYLGGTYSGAATSNSVLFSRSLNGLSQALLTVGDFNIDSYHSVNDIEIFSNNVIMVGGKFLLNQGFTMFPGSNLLKYDLVSGTFQLSALFNDEVHTIGKRQNTYYLGGKFTSNGGMFENIHHLAKHQANVGIDEQVSESNVLVTPNPSTGKFSIEGLENQSINAIELIDLQGKTRLILQTSQNTVDASTVPDGMYFVKINLVNQPSITLKWLKIAGE
jgi:hypothetical protein